MDETQADLLLTYIAAIDRRPVEPGDAALWADLLDDIPYEPAKAAVREYYREESRWITPAEIRRRAFATRKAERRQSKAPPGPQAVPDADPDDVPGYLRALAEGRWRPEVEARTRPLGQLLAAYAATTVIPADDDGPHADGPLSVPCPWMPCRAEVGEPCRTAFGRTKDEPHPARVSRAERS